jgi:hypothetical protein
MLLGVEPDVQPGTIECGSCKTVGSKLPTSDEPIMGCECNRDVTPTISESAAYNPVESVLDLIFHGQVSVKMPEGFVRRVLVLITLVVIAFSSLVRAHLVFSVHKQVRTWALRPHACQLRSYS